MKKKYLFIGIIVFLPVQKHIKPDHELNTRSRVVFSVVKLYIINHNRLITLFSADLTNGSYARL